MIKVQQIGKQVKDKAILNNVSFHVNSGEIFGLVGPNGAGKSTLLSILATIARPTAGDVLINGHSVVKQPRDIRKLIGYVPQEVAIYPTLSVLDNLRLFAAMAETKVKEDKIHEILTIVGLVEQKKQKAGKLSGGMKRRLNIGVALLHDPLLLIMDEPTVGVDIQSKREFLQFIKALGQQGKTIIYTSHDSAEIEYLCSRLAVLNGGRLLFEGTLQEARDIALQKNASPMTFDDVLSIIGHY